MRCSHDSTSILVGLLLEMLPGYSAPKFFFEASALLLLVTINARALFHVDVQILNMIQGLTSATCGPLGSISNN